MRSRWMLPVALLVCAAALPQSNGDVMKACNDAAFRQFDFWIGDWEVRDRDGKLAGHNVVTLEQGGCVLIERWTGVSGHGGMSMNYYEPRSRQWKQHWVSPNLILEMSGSLQDDSLVMEGPMQYIGRNETTLLRGTWTPLPDARVRQHFVESKDAGKTWQEWFDGYYSKVK